MSLLESPVPRTEAVMPLVIEPRWRPLWERCELGQLQTTPGVSVHHLTLLHPQPKGSIVFSNGRVESFVKYLELFQCFYDAGYSLFALDHRGQGLSSRLTVNPHLGHVGRFSDYLDDFHQFVSQVVQPRAQGPMFLAGHSMGGAIGTLYLRDYPGRFQAGCFSAPMYGIRLPVHPSLIRLLARALELLAGGKPTYVPGGTDYKPVPFADNELTTSEARYQAYRTLYAQNPRLQLGSPSNRWLLEALDACDESRQAASSSQTPILLLQAERDSIVDNKAQLAARGSLCELRVIAGAKHEILIEADGPRNQAITAMLAFFERNQG